MTICLSRRRLLASAAVLCAVSTGFFSPLPALADKTPAGKVDVAELMAPNALPDIVQGDAGAPVTIVEYASMTCSHCAAFHHDVYPQLKKNQIDTGKVKFILREFPLDPLATAAFMLVRELGADKRDAAVDLLFAQQKNWAFTEKPLDGLASVLKQAGLGQEKFEAILKDQELYKKVNEVRDRGGKFGVDSTPTFFINGERYKGEMSIADFDKIIAVKTGKSQ